MGLRLEQVETLRTACYETGAEYLQQRNEATAQLVLVVFAVAVGVWLLADAVSN